MLISQRGVEKVDVEVEKKKVEEKKVEEGEEEGEKISELEKRKSVGGRVAISQKQTQTNTHNSVQRSDGAD